MQSIEVIKHQHYYLMSDQFNFEEINAVDWLKDASQWTDKHPLTLSEVSKDHFLDYLLDQDADNKAVPHHKTITHHKEKKNLNAKNYRDKKRNQFESMKKEIQQLQQENHTLKSQKYCRWCKKSYAPNIIYTSSTSSRQQQAWRSKQSSYDRSTQMEFQQPQFFSKKRDAKKGKIWVAIGILMLVLGLALWGFDGDKSFISKIEVERQQVSKWLQQISEREKNQYMQVNYKIQPDNDPNPKNKGSDLQVRFRSPTERDVQAQEEEQFEINKDILYSIHAELQDIGLYI